MPYLQNIVQPFSRKKKQDLFLLTYICTILVHVVQLVGLVSLHLQGSFVGLVGPVALVGQMGLVSLLGYCDLIQKYFQIETRSCWLNWELRGDEPVYWYWVSIGHFEAVAVGN